MTTDVNKKICLELKNIIENVSTEYDKIWRKRARKIDSKFLINFIFQLVLNSRKGYGIILSELWDDYLSKKIEPPQKEVYSISSICESRQKLPEEIFKAINEKILTAFKDIKAQFFFKESQSICNRWKQSKPKKKIGTRQL